MKARFGLLVLILALSASLSVAQSLGWWTSPWAGSFRKASTAGLLEDDLDLMLDPARLPLIEGNRLYTNLSNLVGKSDNVFGTDNNGYYLLGGSGKLMDFGYGGLLYDRNLDRQYDTTTQNATNLVDLDANGTYDRKLVGESVIHTGHQIKSTDWWVGYSHELGPGKFGLLFYHSVGNDFEQPDSVRGLDTLATDYSTKLTLTDLVTGAVIGAAEISSNANFVTKTNINGGALSFWYAFNDKIDLGLAGGIKIRKVEQFDSITYALKSNNPSAPGTNGTIVDSTVTGDIIPTFDVGMNIIGRVAGVYKWSDKVKTRTDIYFSTLVSGKKDDSYQKSTYHSLTAFLVPTGTQSRDVNRVNDGRVTQEDHFSNAGITSNTFVKFGEKVEMAIGLGVDSYNRDFTNTVDGTYDETINFNDGDANTYNDSMIVTTGTTKQTQMYTEACLSVNTPVCVEFHITRPFVFRLGANHTFAYRSTTENETAQTTPDLVTTYTGQNLGVVTYSKPATYLSRNGQSFYHKYATSELNYSYGAGWEISKNLQIDLMGFAKLDDMTNWKLSAVFKF